MEIYDNDEGDDDSDGGIEVDDENDEETMLPVKGEEESSSGMLKTFSWKYNPGNIFMHRCIDKTERFHSVMQSINVCW